MSASATASVSASATATAVERIVVQATPMDKQAIVAKARRLEMPVAELMRRAAFAYESEPAGAEADAELAALADAARSAAERAGTAIDDALDFIARSNRRIAAMEAEAALARAR